MVYYKKILSNKVILSMTIKMYTLANSYDVTVKLRLHPTNDINYLFNLNDYVVFQLLSLILDCDIKC